MVVLFRNRDLVVDVESLGQAPELPAHVVADAVVTRERDFHRLDEHQPRVLAARLVRRDPGVHRHLQATNAGILEPPGSLGPRAVFPHACPADVSELRRKVLLDVIGGYRQVPFLRVIVRLQTVRCRVASRPIDERTQPPAVDVDVVTRPERAAVAVVEVEPRGVRVPGVRRSTARREHPDRTLATDVAAHAHHAQRPLIRELPGRIRVVVLIDAEEAHIPVVDAARELRAGDDGHRGALVIPPHPP